MDDHAKDVVREIAGASEQERVGFPEIVEALMAAGVERYHADLLAGTKTWYMPDGSFEITHGPALAAAMDFRGDIVQEAVHAIQQGEIGYRAFCDRIAAAGCVGYFVSLAGKRSVYYGRTLAAHVAWFTGPLPPPPGPPPSRRAS
jgi:uncharacterized protein YbcV (DUF1398 family)